MKRIVSQWPFEIFYDASKRKIASLSEIVKIRFEKSTYIMNRLRRTSNITAEFFIGRKIDRTV